MKKLVLLFLVLGAVLRAQSESIDLGNFGKITLYLPDGWVVTSTTEGEKKVVAIVPKKDDVNAEGSIRVVITDTDVFPTRGKLKAKVEAMGERYVENSVEGKAVGEALINLKPGFGYLCTFTDPRPMDKLAPRGDYKTVSLGMIRLSPSVCLEFFIGADSVKSKPYQDMLGILEGMDFDAPKDRRGTI